MNEKYSDMIGLPHPVSVTRARMDPANRAAQFAPFAALTGYEAAISETARLTDQRVELSEHRRWILDEQTQAVLDRLPEQPWVRITYFAPDPRKSGGSYVSETLRIKKVDLFHRTVTAVTAEVIPMDDIWEIEIL